MFIYIVYIYVWYKTDGEIEDKGPNGDVEIRDFKQRGRERERRRLRKITFLFRSLLLCADHLGLFICLKTLRIAKRLNVSP